MKMSLGIQTESFKFFSSVNHPLLIVKRFQLFAGSMSVISLATSVSFATFCNAEDVLN